MDKIKRQIKQEVRSYNQVPATIMAVDTIVEAFGILEERIKQLSIQLMIERNNVELMNDRIKELEGKPQCCTEEKSKPETPSHYEREVPESESDPVSKEDEETKKGQTKKASKSGKANRRSAVKAKGSA